MGEIKLDGELIVKLHDQDGMGFGAIGRLLGTSDTVVSRNYYNYTGKTPKRYSTKNSEIPIMPIVKPTPEEEYERSSIYILRKCSICNKLFTIIDDDYVYKTLVRRNATDTTYNYQCSYTHFRQYQRMCEDKIKGRD